ncbi:trypsin-like serine protease [Colwelliaceae bacterium 6441]
MKDTNKINKIARSVSLLAMTGLIASSAVSFSASADKGDAKTQIVGGTESTPHSRPYQVALLMNGRQGCGGTLISSEWVLTAGHCLDSASTSSLTVQIGAHVMGAGGDGTNHRVSQIIKHENWRGAQSIQSGYDIAVLRLATPASSSVTPASLPTQAIANQIAAVGQNVTVSGWGLTYNGSRTPATRLREVALPVISNSSCSSELGVNVGNGVICGGGPNGKSACNGDSGGPYAAQSGGKFYSIGTVSWGKACSGATAFTRTTAYLDWIEQKTGVKPDGATTDQAPTARFSAQTNGLTVDLTNSSTDDNGIASSSWNFGDGSSSNASSPSHTYTQDGSYTVTLKVTDTAGQTNSTAQSITVSSGDQCPSGYAAGYAAWNASTLYSIGERVSYNGTDYEATWWSQGATPTIYTNVWKSLGDNGGDGGNNCPDDNVAPTASFSVSTSDLVASFTDSSTDDKGVVSHSWNFGDGTGSASANPTHTYYAEGNYSVTLTVTDAEGESHSTSQTVSVSEGGVDQGCEGLTEWSPTTSYAYGDEVSYKGYKYESIWWSTAAAPDVFSNVWTNKGACN